MCVCRESRCVCVVSRRGLVTVCVCAHLYAPVHVTERG